MSKKYKKLLELLDSAPTEKCNDLKLQSLKEAGEKIKKTSFNSLPENSKFKSDLKTKILEKRQYKSLSMSEKFGMWIKNYFHSVQFKAGIAVILLVAIVFGAFRFWPDSSGRISKLLIDTAYAQDNFEVEATKRDSIGVDSTTGFVIKSKQALTKDELVKHITVIPEIKFDLNKVSDHEFKLVPKESLASKTIYKVFIGAAYVNDQGITTDRDFSWAFQVKDTFKILGTLPADKTISFPLNSGIEINFSHENFSNDFEKNISISPKTEGRFERHGRTVVFVPKALKPGIIYTVTVNKDFSLQGSDETLVKEYKFQFETAPQETKGYSQASFNTDFTEFSTNQTPLLPVYTYNFDKTVSSSWEISVYSFKNVDDFVNNLKEKEKIPLWASYNQSKLKIDTNKLSKVTSFTNQVQEYLYNQYIEFPTKLQAGYYLVEGNYNGEIRQAFIQVTDLASYISINKDKSLIWVNDLVTQNSVSNATVEEISGLLKTKTNDQGLVVFDTDNFIKPEDIDKRIYRYLKVASGNKSAVLRVGQTSYYGDYYDEGYNGSFSSDYWSYVYTDRGLYQPNDTINIWGFVKSRSTSEKPEKVTIALLSNSYDYYNNPVALSEADAQVTKEGNFVSNLKLDHVSPGYYNLVVSIGEKIILNRYISVETYSKPAYKLEVIPDKKAVFSNEKVGFTVKAHFFEGTPVSKLKLKYIFNKMKGELTLNDTGEARIDFFPEYVGDRYTINSLEVSPASGEEGDIKASARVYVFGPSIQMDSKFEQTQNTKAKLTITTQKISPEKINSSNDYYADIISGKAPQIPFNVLINEISYVPVEDGEYYDFVEKKVIKRYRYERVEKPFQNFNDKTDNEGNYTQELNVDKEKSYEVIIEARDAKGFNIRTRSYLYTAEPYSEDGYTYYSLKFKNSDNSNEDKLFKKDEQVQIDFQKNGKLLTNTPGKFLFFTLKNGLINQEIKTIPNYTFNFEEKYIPNVEIGAVFFDKTGYHKIDETINAKFNIEEKELNISVKPDKEKYVPGEQVKLVVEVKDKQGKPVETSLNLNLVDEAFYELNYEIADPLHDLYHVLPSGAMYTYSTHPYILPTPAGAEGGGCFLDGTKITMADGTVKNIEDIKIGDHILTFKDEYNKQLVSGVVIKTYEHMVREYLIINNRLFVTPEHRIFVNHTWRPISDAKIGDTLLDSFGRMVKIESIEKRSDLVRVHNFQVENYHTYLADGIYVHNDKGGMRQYFTDVALFTNTQTDKNGKAEVTFKLPDNITSWRVTTQAISPTLLAGVNTTNLPVSLPLFIDATVPNQYLISDEPIIKARSFGENLKSNSPVQFSFESQSLGIPNQNRTSEAYKTEYFNLPKLTLGNHEVKFGIKNNNFEDSLLRKFVVINSRVQEKNREFSTLSENVKLNGSETNRTTLVFSDAGKSKFYYDLLNLKWNTSDRVDSKLAKELSNNLLNIYLDEKNFENEMNSENYQDENGGIKLLPYGSPELELSSLVALSKSNTFDKVKLKNYFYTVLNKKDVNKEEFSLALLGLASLEEPILPTLQRFSKISDLSVQEKVYTGLALGSVGDEEAARKMYKEIVEKYGENLNPYLKLNINKDENTNNKFTMLTAILGAKLNTPDHEVLWNYAVEKYSSEVSFNLEKYIYIDSAIKHIPQEKASFVVVLNGKEKEYKIENEDSITLSVTPSELQSLSFRSLKGKIGVVSIYDKPVEFKKFVNQGVGIKREYYVDGKMTNEFNQGDLVEVRLYPSFSPAMLDDVYQITDYVPSGLKATTRYPRLSNENACVKFNYPYEINEQSVKFLEWNWIGMNEYGNCGKRSYFSYYLRVVNSGTYTAESAIIESAKSNSVKNFSEATKVIIKQ